MIKHSLNRISPIYSVLTMFFFFKKKRKLYTVQHNHFQLEHKFTIFNMSLQMSILPNQCQRNHTEKGKIKQKENQLTRLAR